MREEIDKICGGNRQAVVGKDDAVVKRHIPKFTDDEVRQALVSMTGRTKGIETVTPDHPSWYEGVRELQNRWFFRSSTQEELTGYFLTTFANDKKIQPIFPIGKYDSSEGFVSDLLKRTDPDTQAKSKRAIVDAIDAYDMHRSPYRFRSLVGLISSRWFYATDAIGPLIKKVDAYQAIKKGRETDDNDIKNISNNVFNAMSGITGLARVSRDAYGAIKKWFNDDNFDPSFSPIFVSVLLRFDPDSYPQLLKRMYERVDTMEGYGPDEDHPAPSTHVSMLGANKTAELLRRMDEITLNRFMRDLTVNGVYNVDIGDKAFIDKETGEVFPVVTYNVVEAEKVRKAFGALSPKEIKS